MGNREEQATEILLAYNETVCLLKFTLNMKHFGHLHAEYEDTICINRQFKYFCCCKKKDSGVSFLSKGFNNGQQKRKKIHLNTTVTLN